MSEPEEQIHSFVLKFWQEEVGVDTGQSLWRGHITHVASGTRQYLSTLDNIGEFIAPYLQRNKRPLSKWQWFRRWVSAKICFWQRR